MSDDSRVILGLFIAVCVLFGAFVFYKISCDMYERCLAKSCPVGFPAYSYGPDRVNPVTGKSIGRGSDSACYCVQIAGDEPK